MGQYLRERVTAEFQPHFIISGKDPNAEKQLILISDSIITDMIDRSKLDIEVRISMLTEYSVTTVDMCLTERDTYPISGFPRKLAEEPQQRRKHFSLIPL
jgi:hypothetical protein